jgi:xanthine/uracil/vitamin C permease (AzgA family)
MNQPYSRISENVLFATLLAAVIGWTAVSVVTDQPAASSPAPSFAATTAIGNS